VIPRSRRNLFSFGEILFLGGMNLKQTLSLRDSFLEDSGICMFIETYPGLVVLNPNPQFVPRTVADPGVQVCGI